MAGEPWDPVERDKRYRNAKADGLTRLLSEGDSWFDYPPHPNIIDWLEAEGRWAIKRLEKSGDTVENMASDANLSLLETLAGRERPVAFLFSGGGNDLFTAIPERPDLKWIWRALVDHLPGMTPAEHINRLAWAGKVNDIRGGYLRILERMSPFAPMITHGYDFLIASGVKVLYDGFRAAGPWIRLSMLARGITDDQLQQDILAILINDFNRMLAGLQADHPADLIHVDLRGELVPGTDWMNELHPTEDGFRQIAARFVDAIDNRLPLVHPGVIA